MQHEQDPAMRALPLAPEDVVERKQELIPSSVIETFNRFIAENIHDGYARVVQDHVVESLVGQGLDRGQIFAKHWLDIEDIYREVGWKVDYDKPGYNETYKAYFEFRTPGCRY